MSKKGHPARNDSNAAKPQGHKKPHLTRRMMHCNNRRKHETPGRPK